MAALAFGFHESLKLFSGSDVILQLSQLLLYCGQCRHKFDQIRRFQHLLDDFCSVSKLLDLNS